MNDELLEKLATFSSFTYMKENFDAKRKISEANALHTVPELRNDRISTRKGIIGDWKTMLSEEQSRKMNDRFKEKTCDHPDLRAFWDEYGVFDENHTRC